MPTIRRSSTHLALQQILVGRRNTAGLSQEELAARLGRPQSFVSKLESGERRLAVTELVELAEAFGCPAEEIVAELVRAATAAPSSEQLESKPTPRRRPKRG